MEVWEKVFIGDATFMESTHGIVGCVVCHGGDGTLEDKESAHTGVVRDPSDITCESCHSDINHANTLSLHTTVEGFKSAMEARGGDVSEGSILSEALENHCTQCHTTCGQCHVSRPEDLDGGLVSDHEFRGTPSMQYTCIACHGARVGAEYLGENEGYPADIHWTQETMTCVACHDEDLHGDGTLSENRYSNSNTVKCEDCHEDIWTDTSDNEQHAQHLSDLSCQVCHSVSYKNCYGCHISLDDEGIPCRTSEPSVMQFEIGYNPIRSSERPYQYVVLRHVPTCSDTCTYYGDNLLPNYDDVSTWKYATPHNIQLHTPQNESCEACHGNEEIFLTPEDIRPEEIAANSGVVVEEIPDGE